MSAIHFLKFNFDPKKVFKNFNLAPKKLHFDPIFWEAFQLAPSVITKLPFQKFGISQPD